MPLTPTERHLVKDWPADLVQIAEVVGVECAETIARTLGGYTVKFGQHKRKPPANKLSALVGPERYRALAEAFTMGIGRLEIIIPGGSFLRANQERRMADDLFWDAVDNCKSVPEIANRIGTTQRTVRRKMRKFGLTAADLKSNSKGTDR